MIQKKTMKRLVSILCIVTLFLSLISCSPKPVEDNKDNEYNEEVSASTAIYLAQKSSKVQNAIADLYGLKTFYEPDWGTCTYEADFDSYCWKVTLKGNISGYTDDFRTKLVHDKKFSAIVIVTPKGNIQSVTAKKAY